MRRRLFVVAIAAAGCHVVARTETTRPTAVERVQHPEAAVAKKPALVMTEAGRLRFVEPLECPTEEIVASTRVIEVVTKPNVATFVVGAIAAGVGGVMLVNGFGNADTSSNPFTYAGLALAAGGLPLAIGPFVGTGTAIVGGEDSPPVRQPGANQPCGERALAASAATLAIHGIEVRGAIDRDGVFAVSPYTLVDAFDAADAPPLDITAHVDGGRTVSAIIDATTLAKHAPAFLAHADFDAKIEPIRLVPGVAPGQLHVSLTADAAGPAVRILLPIKNDGPGGAWALRGRIAAPGTPALDGRVLYIGALAKGTSTTRELLVPVAPDAAAALRNAAVDLSIELRDAHGTAPSTPIRFRGPVLVDAPRS